MSEIPNQKKSIKNWAEDDRPREKMLLKGRLSLSNAELLAILINTGNRVKSALDLARDVLSLTDNRLDSLGKLSVHDLKKIKGIGEAKAITIAAALELGRRRREEDNEEKMPVKSSKDAYLIFAPLLGDLIVEEFWIALLSRNNIVQQCIRISQGGVHATVVDIRIIAKHALEHVSSGMIVCHNHPSGNLIPSEQDKALTQKIKHALNLIDVSLMDHIIIGGKGYFSFADEGLL